MLVERDYTVDTGVLLDAMRQEQKAHGGFWYVTSPYSHAEKWIQQKRFLQAAVATGWLIQNGVIAYSPIAHSHPINEACHMEMTAEDWYKFDLHFIDRACGIVVICMRGFEESTGIDIECRHAQGQDKPLICATRRDMPEPAFRLCGPVFYENHHFNRPIMLKVRSEMKPIMNMLRRKDGR